SESPVPVTLISREQGAEGCASQVRYAIAVEIASRYSIVIEISVLNGPPECSVAIPECQLIRVGKIKVAIQVKVRSNKLSRNKSYTSGPKTSISISKQDLSGTASETLR